MIENIIWDIKQKKNKSQIIKIPSNFINLKEQLLMKNYYKETKKRSFEYSKRSKKLLEKINYNINDTVTIQKDSNRYYIYLTYDTKKIDHKKPHRVVSIDSGVRNFATIYSPDGIEGFLGKNIVDELITIGRRIDKLTSIKEKKEGNHYNKKYKTRKNIEKRCSKLRTKIKNKVTNLHWQAINFLCTNFETIIIPQFRTSMKIPKNGRKINNKTVRGMLSLSHGKFLERLDIYSKRVKTNIIKVNEDYTSKTCGNCGEIDEKLGGKKEYKCINCGAKIDRDINGARNILIKTLTDNLSCKKSKKRED